MDLERLKRYGERLHCVVTLTEDLARAQAAGADKEIKAGKYRGPLHGIPFGVKGLFDTPPLSSGCVTPAACSSRSCRWARSPRAASGSAARRATRGRPITARADRPPAPAPQPRPASSRSPWHQDARLDHLRFLDMRRCRAAARDLRQRRSRRDRRRCAVHVESRRTALQPDDWCSRQRVRTERRVRRPRWRRPRRRESGRGAPARRSAQHAVDGGARRPAPRRREARADVAARVFGQRARFMLGAEAAAAFDDLTRSKGIDQLTEQGPRRSAGWVRWAREARWDGLLPRTASRRKTSIGDHR